MESCAAVTTPFILYFGQASPLQSRNIPCAVSRLLVSISMLVEVRERRQEHHQRPRSSYGGRETDPQVAVPLSFKRNVEKTKPEVPSIVRRPDLHSKTLAFLTLLDAKCS